MMPGYPNNHAFKIIRNFTPSTSYEALMGVCFAADRKARVRSLSQSETDRRFHLHQMPRHGRVFRIQVRAPRF